MVFLIELDSPNFISRNSSQIQALVVKSVVGENKKVIDKFLSPNYEEGTHYLVDNNGELFQMIHESKAVITPNFSYWRGIENFDLKSIVITLVTPKEGQFSEAQIETLIKIAQEKITTYQIPMTNIVSACDVSFLMYSDYGFPWQKMAENNVGLWVDSEANLNVNSENSEDLLEMLDSIGYKINIQNYKLAIIAFQKHFLPENISGENDNKTIQRAKQIKTLFNS